jgi:hypothetical protein
MSLPAGDCLAFNPWLQLELCIFSAATNSFGRSVGRLECCWSSAAESILASVLLEIHGQSTKTANGVSMFPRSTGIHVQNYTVSGRTIPHYLFLYQHIAHARWLRDNRETRRSEMRICYCRENPTSMSKWSEITEIKSVSNRKTYQHNEDDRMALCQPYSETRREM